MSKKLNSIMESLVVIMILLVLVQTFMDDFAVMSGWTWDIRIIFIYTGFIFDLFFTLEFLVRLYRAILKGRIKEYIFQEHGWIDFLASVPLLILNSGPTLLAVMAGGGFFGVGGALNVLKVVKAIRIARVLRLLRVLKIFKQIKHTDSVMAQRHVAKITTISISVFIFTLFFFTVFSDLMGFPSMTQAWTKRHTELVNALQADRGIETINAVTDDLLMVNKDSVTVFSRYTDAYYHTWFGLSGYRYIRVDNMEYFLDMRELNQLEAGQNIIFFISIIVLVLVFLFSYSPHFAITVTDPIHVMRRGLKENGYNFEVRIPEKYSDDDIFQLAQNYNEEFLPLKVRNNKPEESVPSGLQLSDIEDIFNA